MKEEVIAQEFLTNSIKRFIDCEKQDMLTITNKINDIEQQLINLNAKMKSNYLLVNDRYNSAFDMINELERKLNHERE
jgi:hypothetical protein